MGGCVVRPGWCVICKQEWDSTREERWDDRICRQCTEIILNHPLLIDEDAIRQLLAAAEQKLAAVIQQRDALKQDAEAKMANRTWSQRVMQWFGGEAFGACQWIQYRRPWPGNRKAGHLGSPPPPRCRRRRPTCPPGRPRRMPQDRPGAAPIPTHDRGSPKATATARRTSAGGAMRDKRPTEPDRSSARLAVTPCPCVLACVLYFTPGFVLLHAEALTGPEREYPQVPEGKWGVLL